MRIRFPSPEDDVCINCEKCDSPVSYSHIKKILHCFTCDEYTNFVDWAQSQYEDSIDLEVECV